MSTQSPSIILGQRIGPVGEELAGGDLQQLVGRLVFVLRHRRWLFILPTLTGMLGVLVVSLCIPRQYSLRAVFECRNDPVLTKLVSSTPFDFKPLRGAMRFNLIGYQAVERAVDEIGLSAEFPRTPTGELTPNGRESRQALVSALVSELMVYHLEASDTADVVEIRYTGKRPEIGHRLVNQLKDNYLAEAQILIDGIQSQAQGFFADEATKRREQVVRMQGELTQVLAQEPEIDPGRPDYLDQAMATENLAIEQLQRSRRDIASDIDTRRDYLAELDQDERFGHPLSNPSRPSLAETRIAENPARSRLEGEITSVLSQIADAKTVKGMKEAHPQVENLRLKLKELHVELNKVPDEIAGKTIEPEEAPPTPYDAERKRIQMELKSLEARINQIDEDIKRHESSRVTMQEKKRTLFERRQAFMLRQQELGNIRSDMSIWDRNLDEINRLLTAEAGNCGIKLSTVEAARCPEKPIKPKLSGTFMLSSGVGLALGVVLVFLREIFDRSFRDPARVRQALGIPVLETIGEIRAPGDRRWMSGPLLTMVVVVQVAGILGMGALVYLSLEQPDTYDRLSSWFGAGSRLTSLVVGGQ